MKIHYLFLLFAFIIGLSSCEKQDVNTTDDEEEFHYELPVIFHVLYKDKTEPTQYVPQNKPAEILDGVNKIYKGNANSPNINLTFTLATTDPDGKNLSVPGVEYIEWPDSYPINCDEFMNDDLNENGKGYVKYLWDPNKYINVMIYKFTDDNIANGIAHLPYSTKGIHYLDGLNETNYSYMGLNNLSYPHCISINTLYINDQSTSEIYNPNDMTVTLAHELGHYLGLHHVFFETENEGDCEDTDYCEDTPTYNRTKYDADYLYIMNYEPENYTFDYLVNRENCQTGQKFIAHNIMDYVICYSDQITQDQRKRIRHVLNYSPLIPGPKKGQIQTRSAAPEGILNLPIRTVE